MAKKTPSMAARHATPKKSKRKPRQVLRPAQRFDWEPTPEVAEESRRPLAATGPSLSRARLRSTIQVLSSDYEYVASDLKRIAMVAGVLIVVMVVLAFVLR